MQLFYKILKLQEQMVHLRKKYFFEHVLFSGQWWLLVIITLVLWTAWILLVDRTRLKNIMIVGLITLGFAIVLDDTGLSLHLWDYPYKLFFFATRLDPVDLVILPFALMMIYQYGRSWISYTVMVFLFALFAALVAEPIFVKLDMYTMIHWKHIYSVPIYFGIGLVARAATDFITWIERKANEKA
ncbi:MAG TPA: CBO0543 family protein [Bacillales bacterium]|nr:CBO0543 family protein [Bacillales bacterium]